MKNERKLEMIWAISLMVSGCVSLIYAIINIAEFEISHATRMVIAIIQIIAVIVLILTSALKLKNRRKSGRK